MTLQLASGIYFLAVAIFGLYAMYKNDEVIKNRWLFLCGWFMWGCMMCIVTNIFLSYTLVKGFLTVAQLDMIHQGFTAIVYSPLSAAIFSIGFIFYSMYLFSLRHRDMEVEEIPNTFVRWIIKILKKNKKPND